MTRKTFDGNLAFNHDELVSFLSNDPLFCGFAGKFAIESGAFPDFATARFEFDSEHTFLFDVPFFNAEGDQFSRIVGFGDRFGGNFLATSISKVSKGGFDSTFSERFLKFAAA